MRAMAAVWARVDRIVFAAPDLEGEVRTSAEFRGKPLLVYFFEADCERCTGSTA